MKKIILALSAVLLIITNSSAMIRVTEYNGGPCGYNSVRQGRSGDEDRLDCNDPGYCDCRFEDSPTCGDLQPEEIDASFLEIRNVLQQRIAEGRFGGEFKSNLGSVAWTYNEGLLTYTIDNK
ncbi:hypothetical protein VRU48_14960 [Pedobacter sp. KR3-3]|uniref:Secreted protein n=1 Tax=Pedobacter albus TaxID=3113905 RepID=A0ABU7IAB7_9SPHI|nr:hypothetical protein [Pedobacter sp. KR3-3]MEE1946422.1 hypothetical protein [Pedobacter sp. KR3-3]